MLGQCSECKKKFEIQPDWIGQKAQCPYCKAITTIQECGASAFSKLDSNVASLGMWDCYIKAFKNYGTFTGRASRREYWYFALAHFIVTFLFSLLITIVARAEIASLSNLVASISGIYHFASIIPYWALAVRRLHDIDKSGWNIFLLFIPLIGGIWLLVYECTRGTIGPNQYGDDPYSGTSNE